MNIEAEYWTCRGEAYKTVLSLKNISNSWEKKGMKYAKIKWLYENVENAEEVDET